MFLPVLHLDKLVHTLGQIGACKLPNTFKGWLQMLWEALRDVQGDQWIAKFTGGLGSGGTEALTQATMLLLL